MSLSDSIEEMALFPGVELPAQNALAFSTGQGLNFSAFVDRPSISTSLTTAVHEGGDDRTRWSEFNRVAGFEIHCARTGAISLEEAKTNTRGWMAVNMLPPWPEVRFETEWRGMVNVDTRKHGAMTPTQPQSGPSVIDMQPLPGSINSYASRPITDWSVDSWGVGERPVRKFLVRGIIQAAKPHMLASEGGAGKTFLLLDLALKIALHKPGTKAQWCGGDLTDDAGGTVVMFTTEDDKTELEIRMFDIDPDKRRLLTEGRLIIIPTVNTGGAFPLVERDKATGTAVWSRAWKALLEQLRAIPDLRVVIIDTLNTTLHGEENNATIINEYMQAAASPICGELGAALIITHHVRKPGANAKISSPEDMKNSIRGSSALIGAFRAVLGVWHAPDFEDRLKKMGQEPEKDRLYNFAVVKANNPEMIRETKTLLRDRHGLLHDITLQEDKAKADEAAKVEAWLLRAVAYAAEHGHPFTTEGAAGLSASPPRGRRHQLPAILQDIGEKRLVGLCGRLVKEGALVRCNAKGGGGKTYKYLDVPDGAMVRNVGPDGNEFRVLDGADFDPPHPSWEMVFAYHPVQRRTVFRRDLAKGQIDLGGAQSAGPQGGADEGLADAADDAPSVRYNPGISDG